MQFIDDHCGFTIDDNDLMNFLYATYLLEVNSDRYEKWRTCRAIVWEFIL